MIRHLPLDIANRIFDILVEEMDADESSPFGGRRDFIDEFVARVGSEPYTRGNPSVPKAQFFFESPHSGSRFIHNNDRFSVRVWSDALTEDMIDRVGRANERLADVHAECAAKLGFPEARQPLERHGKDTAEPVAGEDSGKVLVHA
jgi:hypothetical protein